MVADLEYNTDDLSFVSYHIIEQPPELRKLDAEEVGKSAERPLGQLGLDLLGAEMDALIRLSPNPCPLKPREK